MSRKKVSEEIEEDVDEIEVPEEESVVKKSVRFFDRLPNDENIQLIIQKENPQTKRWQHCESFFTSDKLLVLDDVPKVWGHGRFQFLAKKYNEHGKLELFDSCTESFAQPIQQKIETGIQPTESRKEFMEQLIQAKQLFGSDQNTGTLMLEFMRMNQASMDRLADLQRKSEERMLAMFERITDKMSQKTVTDPITSVTGVLEIAERLADLRGGGEKSMLETLLPAVGPAIPGMIQSLTTPPVHAQNTQPTSTQVDPIQTIINAFPDDLKTQLTRENSLEFCTIITTKYPQVPKDLLLKAMDRFLISRGM